VCSGCSVSRDLTCGALILAVQPELYKELVWAPAGFQHWQASWGALPMGFSSAMHGVNVDAYVAVRAAPVRVPAEN
jgi:hypothetical protein